MASSSIAIPSSPIEQILTDAEALGVTVEQRRALEEIDLDFRAEAIRLGGERELLLIAARRSATTDPLLSGLTAECLKEIEAKALELKLARLQAFERARNILFSDQ